ncbi:MAG: serine dehydratase [Sphaerospermopsis sp. SIO1G2]|nr:serine dehydratase [Sphaerospermopsis sp. SIO1G1]NET74189.1 serine dehydratase [Sphaerospermopsis sp. SIO1G2]
MTLIHNQSQDSKHLSDQTKDTYTPTEKSSIYTLENLVQTLEEAANYLAFS